MTNRCRQITHGLVALSVVLAVMLGLGATTAVAQRSGGAPEKPNIVVGALPTTGAAPLYHAQQEGYFEEEGIESVQIKLAVTGVTEGLIGGEFDFVYASYVVPFQARGQGLPILVAAAADQVPPSSEIEPGSRRPGVVVLPSSSIRRAKDLEGRSIGVPTVSIGEVLLYPPLKKAGIDTTKVRLVEVLLPQALQALEQGQVDAIFAPEPYFTEGEETLNTRKVFDAFEKSKHVFPIAGFETTEQFQQSNPQTVAAFRRAIERAAKELNDNDQAFVDILPTYMGLSQERAAALVKTTYSETIPVKDLQRVANSMTKLGLLDEKISVKKMVVDDAQAARPTKGETRGQ